jgi:hypothetical protein
VAASLIIISALAISPTRDAIARLFGVEGSKIEFLPTALPGETATPLSGAFPGATTPLPSATIVVTPRSTPGPRAIAPVDLARVREFAGFDPVLPEVEDPRINSVLIFYGDQAVLEHRYFRFNVYETKLRQDAGFGKFIPDGGRVDEVEVGDVPGLWVTGAEHFVYYYDASGQTYIDSQRVVDRSTLVWRTDAFFYRIETDLSLEETLRIAETLP